jgi:putative efflux protein, MATE family
MIADSQDSLLPTSPNPKKSEGIPFFHLLKNAIPFMLNNLAYFGARNISYHFLKESNESHLIAAAGLALTCINVISVALAGSLNVGLTSRAAQAFGAKEYRLIGIYLHRASIIGAIVMIPCNIALYFIDRIFINFGYDAETVENARLICIYSYPGIFGWIVSNTITSYLTACDLFKPPAIVTTICAVINCIASYVTIYLFDLGIIGFAMSFNIQNVFGAILLVVYVKVKDPVPGSIFWLNKESFQSLWEFFKFEFSAGAMIFVEWVSWEVLYALSGAIGVTELSSFTIVLNNFTLMYVPNFAIMDTAIVFVGNSMGENNPQKAKNYVKAAILASSSFLLLSEIFYIFFVYQVMEFYTDDPKTIELSVAVMRLYQIVMIADFIQLNLMGCLRSIGYERVGSILMTVSYYVIGIPLCFVLALKEKLGLLGIGYGHIVIVYIILFGLLIVYACFVDWEKQAKIISDKIKKDSRAVTLEDLGENLIQNRPKSSSINEDAEGGSAINAAWI